MFPEEAPKKLGCFDITLFNATNVGYVPFQIQWLAQVLSKNTYKMVYCVFSQKVAAPLHILNLNSGKKNNIKRKIQQTQNLVSATELTVSI